MEKEKTYIIAEAGVNHNGSLETAKRMIDVAVSAGVEAVKFQFFKTDKLVTRDAIKAPYQQATMQNEPQGDSQHDMLKKLELGETDLLVLREYCAEKAIDFLVTPFDEISLEYLVNDCKVSKLKISSGDITNAPFLLKAARSGLPIILSTGMATVGEIEQALAVLAYGYGCGAMQDEKINWGNIYNFYFSREGQCLLQQNVSLLQCTTEYPAPVAQANLRAIQTLRNTFGVQSGYSDHTEGIAVATAAVAMGAVFIEKHFTLDKAMPGPDHKASLEPEELRQLVKAIRQVEEALGTGIKIPVKEELSNRMAARKSLVAAQRIRKGESFTEQNLTIKRPGTGLSPLLFWERLGMKAEKEYQADELI